MKAASLKEIKTELQELDADQLVEICLRLAKFKKENKELLTYLVFESKNESAYIEATKSEIAELFSTVSKGHDFFAKKTLRKILRLVNRQSKYSGDVKTEIELRIYYCLKFIENKIPLRKGSVIFNMYNQQMKKINSLVSRLPEDLQFDYENDIGRMMKHL